MLEKTFGLLFYLKARQKSEGNSSLRLPENHRRRQGRRAIYQEAMEHRKVEFLSRTTSRKQGRCKDAQCVLGHAHRQSLPGQEDSD